jgi:hypothetical protein
LEKKYKTIDGLNLAYGTTYRGFAEVKPPSTKPRRDIACPLGDAWHGDWYEVGKDYCRDYLRVLRGMMEELGVKEPQILFSANLPVFPLNFQCGGVQLNRDLLFPDGRKKDVATLGLDLYPKFDFNRNTPHGQPFQADFNTCLFDRLTDRADGTQEEIVFAEELQGGVFSIMPFLPMSLMPESTDQLLCKAVGRGLKGGFLYMLRDGLNADGKLFDYQASIKHSGETTARYEVVKKWGHFLDRYAAELLDAREKTNRIGIVVDSDRAGPLTGRE